MLVLVVKKGAVREEIRCVNRGSCQAGSELLKVLRHKGRHLVPSITVEFSDLCKGINFT